MAKSRLHRYRSRRHFNRTGEPAGRGRARGGTHPRFVVQQHDASHLHFDLRLEIDGALVSWAVPKGPSLDPRVRRLAVRTEDHPLEYADFEGTIPAGEYGAGRVIVWDRGTYHNLQADKPRPARMTTGLRKGLLEFELHGRKLAGGFALKRTGGGRKARWLLVKMDDDGADARRNPVSTEPRSVKSGRTLDELAEPS